MGAPKRQATHCACDAPCLVDMTTSVPSCVDIVVPFTSEEDGVQSTRPPIYRETTHKWRLFDIPSKIHVHNDTYFVVLTNARDKHVVRETPGQ